MSPSLAAELARLLLADPSGARVRDRLSLEPDALELQPLLRLGERARLAGASEEETALALGLLVTLGAAPTKETTGP